MSKNAGNRKVIVAMSGGVDSSVAAFLLREEGYEVVGATIDTGFGRAADEAARICAQLGLEHHVIPARDIFLERVVQPFARDYLAGLTPNPCVECNRRFKFPVFWPLMAELDADKLATGHYCHIFERDGRYGLRRAEADGKDQTYFLCRLDQHILSRCLFPIGDYTKEQVRRIAAEQGLASARQKDSFDICFITDGDYRACVREHAATLPLPGDIVDLSGRIVGRHNGLFEYTVGQRRGLNVALGYPAYVVRLERAENRVVIGPREALWAKEAVVLDVSLISGESLTAPLRALVRIRSQAEPAEAVITPLADGRAGIKFATPVWAPAAGQSAVFYDGDILLGGGYIV